MWHRTGIILLAVCVWLAGCQPGPEMKYGAYEVVEAGEGATSTG